MPEVNLLKDTKNNLAAAKKTIAPGAPELTNPTADSGAGIFGKFKSLFKRAPRTLPVVPAPPTPVRAVGMSAPVKGTSGERILSETKHAPAAMIPLPEDEGGYNVNLLSDDLVTTVNPKQRAVMLGVVVLAAAVVVGLVYGGLVFYQGKVKSDIESTKSQLEAVDKEITAVKTEQAVALTTVQKLNAIKGLVDRHTRWTKFFAMIERYTLPEVTYGSSFSGDLNGSVTFTATTTTYEKVAQQYLMFQQLVRDGRFISAFTITGATSKTSKDGVVSTNFTVGLTLLPNNFTMTSDEFLAATKIDTNTISTPVPEIENAGESIASVGTDLQRVQALDTVHAYMQTYYLEHQTYPNDLLSDTTPVSVTGALIALTKFGWSYEVCTNNQQYAIRVSLPEEQTHYVATEKGSTKTLDLATCGSSPLTNS